MTAYQKKIGLTVSCKLESSVGTKLLLAHTHLCIHMIRPTIHGCIDGYNYVSTHNYDLHVQKVLNYVFP